MRSVTLFFKIHQAYHLNSFPVKDISVQHSYFDLEATRNALDAAADNCYLPANEILLEQLKKYGGKFKICFSISGVTLEMMEQFRPDVLRSFRELVRTGYVEMLAETYYNSLSWLHSKKEFESQLEKHTAIVKRLLGTVPVVFRNTELIYNNELAKFISGLGYNGILCEGLQRILKGRSPNIVYKAPDNGNFGILLRNVNLSDDIAFRFDDAGWDEHPLMADKFAQWIHEHNEEGSNINLFMDYETFGTHKKESTGILEFLKALPAEVLANSLFSFTTPSEVLDNNYPKGIYDVPQTISWEDKSADNCVYCENMEQNNTLRKIYSLSNCVKAAESENVLDTWGRLQAADYFYYMHEGKKSLMPNSPYLSTENPYSNYLNILTDFEVTLIKYNLEKYKNQHSALHFN